LTGDVALSSYNVTSEGYVSGDGKANTDMLDYRLHYAVMATEDRVRSLRRERKLQQNAARVGRLPVDRKAPRQA
jgi:hypothetical protein